MSKLVGFPTAITSRLVLEGKINKKGVFGPFKKKIYDIMYKEMIDSGLVNKFVTRNLEPSL